MYANEPARAEEETQEDLLSAYFEKSATVVRQSFGRFERELARPTVRYVMDSYRDHPIHSTLLTIYAALSALPLLSFIGFAVFVFSSFTFFALSVAFLAGAAVVLFTGFWLACLLTLLFFLAIPLTASTLATYLLLRLVFITRQEGSVRAGLGQWVHETKTRFVLKQQPGAADQDPVTEDDTLIVGSIALEKLTATEGETKSVDAAAVLDGLSVGEEKKVEGTD
ncbi:hypothetical protein C8Q77DRAFT_1109608 [Trametes polyzona]|nr:hypothetical protein C8Q77DRAFT_1109608 [Trametes polyzona]